MYINCVFLCLLPEFFDGVSQVLDRDVILVDRTQPAVGSVVVVLVPAAQVATFVRVHAVWRVPVVVACSPRHICKTVDFRMRQPVKRRVRSQPYGTVQRNGFSPSTSSCVSLRVARVYREYHCMFSASNRIKNIIFQKVCCYDTV